MSNLLAIRGTFFDFVDDPWKHVGNEQASARFHPDGLLVLEHGKIKDFGAYADIGSKYAGVETTHIKDRLVLPGFIDGHVHVPQTRVLGAYGEQLLPWLLTWVFPEEMKYTDRAYADEGTRKFFDNLLASLAHRVARRKVCGRPVLYRIWPVLGHASPGSVVLTPQS